MHRVLTIGGTQRMGDHNPAGRRACGERLSKNGEEFKMVGGGDSGESSEGEGILSQETKEGFPE